MSLRYWYTLGFLELLIFPTIAVFYAIIAQSNTERFFVSALTLTYPIGLLAMLLFPRIMFGMRFFPRARVEFTKGARNGSLAAILVTIPALLFPSSLWVGLSLLLVCIGATWLPAVSELDTFSFLLTQEGYPELFLANARKRSYTLESVATLFLARFSGVRVVAKVMRKTQLIVLGSLLAYLAGWILLSLTGGFPFTFFGLSMLPLIVVIGYASIGKGTGGERRQKLAVVLKSLGD